MKYEENEKKKNFCFFYEYWVEWLKFLEILKSKLLPWGAKNKYNQKINFVKREN